MDNDKNNSIVESMVNQEKDVEVVAEETVQIIIFRIDQEEYAVSIDEIKEVIQLIGVTPIPDTPNFIRGILNLRGKIVVIIDLEKRFNLKREHPAKVEYVIITEVEDNNLGIVVDGVQEVMRVPLSSIRPSPNTVDSKISSDYIKGVVVLGEKDLHREDETSRLIVFLNFSEMLQKKEILKTSEVVKELAKTSTDQE